MRLSKSLYIVDEEDDCLKIHIHSTEIIMNFQYRKSIVERFNEILEKKKVCMHFLSYTNWLKLLIACGLLK